MAVAADQQTVDGGEAEAGAEPEVAEKTADPARFASVFRRFVRGTVGDDVYREPRWSRLALGAVLPSVTGVLWPLGLLLAAAAVYRIRKVGQRGSVLAWLCLAMAVIWLGGGTPVLGPWFGSEAVGPQGRAIVDLKVGDCLSGLLSDVQVKVGEAQVVPCTLPHQGEVYARPSLGDAVYGTDTDLSEEAGKACPPLLSDYAMDSWAIPESVTLDAIYPGHGLSTAIRHSTAICIVEGDRAGWKGTLRRDAGNLTADQLTYLRAARAADDAWAAEPERKPEDHPDIARRWAGVLATGLETETKALAQAGWPGAVGPAVTALSAELAQAVTHLRAAEHAADDATMLAELRLGVAHAGNQQAKAARAALGLATEPGRPLPTGI
ncbi:hypothetical protein [Kitasatospora sp. McL0602]|uniref:hypothetical protein n=1 Tax=Kitasatospora sp. McL0602 TaxID=3439530 RepID=UPI003F890163